MTTKRSKGSLAARRDAREVVSLEAILGGPLTLGLALEGLRRGEELSQSEFARKLGLSSQKLCDIEKGRRHVRPERAAAFARRKASAALGLRWSWNFDPSSDYYNYFTS